MNIWEYMFFLNILNKKTSNKRVNFAIIYSNKLTKPFLNFPLFFIYFELIFE